MPDVYDHRDRLCCLDVDVFDHSDDMIDVDLDDILR